MADLQKRLRTEIDSNHNLLKLNNSLMEQNDAYSAALQTAKAFVYANDHSYDVDDTIGGFEADQIISKLISMKNTPPCNCSKWKELYKNECDESLRLSTLTTQLATNLSHCEQETIRIQSQWRLLLQDYGRLFQKYYSQTTQVSILETKSKSKPKMSTTHRKTPKKDSASKFSTTPLTTKRPQNYQKHECASIEGTERQQKWEQNQLLELRNKFIDYEQLIREYRRRDRERVKQRTGHQEQFT